MKFIKKPEVVEAERWFPNKPVDGVDFPILNPGGYQAGGYIGQGLLKSKGRAVEYVKSGDWIITTTSGEKSRCEPDTFNKLYDVLEDRELKDICQWFIDTYPEEDDTADGSLSDIIDIRNKMLDVLEYLEKG